MGENITLLWAPTGIALVRFLLRGLWTGVAIASFAVNLPISASAVTAAVTAVGNTIAPVAAATLLLRVDFRPQLDRLRDALICPRPPGAQPLTAARVRTLGLEEGMCR